MKIFGSIGTYSIGMSASVMTRAKVVIPAAMRAAKKPAVIGYILMTAHRAQIFLAAAILTLVLIVSPLLDSGLRTVFPEKTSKKLFGLVKEKKENPAREAAHDWIMITLWALAISETLLLVWLHIPRGTSRALSRAQQLESDGDTHFSDQPIESLALYTRAMSLSADPDYEKKLLAKITGITSLGDVTGISSGRLGSTIINSDSGGGDGAFPGFETSFSNGQNTGIGPNCRYSLENELGRGGMGIVYKAWDSVLDRAVALKKLPRSLTDDREYLLRFEREAKTLARLTHPAVVQIHDLFEDRHDIWMALEYIDGGDLASHLSGHKLLPISEAARLAQIIADGMAYAHRQEIIHRDLKPSNILLEKTMEPKISDFGLAKLFLSDSITLEGSILGSPRYMSPEQAAGKVVDYRSDIYSLGIILYEMVTGETPFNGDTAQILTMHITQPPPPPHEFSPDIPKELENLILNMLTKDPDERIGEMTEVSSRLAMYAPTPRTSDAVKR